MGRRYPSVWTKAVSPPAPGSRPTGGPPAPARRVEVSAALSPVESKRLQQAVDMLEKVNDPSARAAKNVIQGVIDDTEGDG